MRSTLSLSAVELTRRLVQIPSVNPMGRELTGPEYYEARVTDFLEDLFSRELRLPFERYEVAPQRANILVRLDGSRNADGRPLLLLEVHQDTIPVDGMTIDPFGGEVRDGRVYGRGATDVKGSMACMLSALARLRDQRPGGLPAVVLACTVNEECGFSGARQLVSLWRSGKSALLPRAPDAAIVAEPTGLHVVVAHKGVLRWRCHTHGKASHSSAPHLGNNAIYLMQPVLSRLERYAMDVVSGLAEHPLVGKPTLAVSTIRGGISNNTVPDRCTIEIDRRLLPTENAAEALEHVRNYLAADAHVNTGALELEQPYLIANGLNDDNNGELADRMVKITRGLDADSKKVGVSYGTNAGAIAPSGVPTVVFGAGSIEQAHTADEWISTDQLELGAEAYYRLCTELF